jgi:uncharacterized protein with beta-barrel porin domain
MRPGQGAVVTNAGLIHSDGVPDAKNDGIDWQGRSGTVINQAGGVISGFRHGITSDEDVNVTNEAGALIEGRNGSGVGSDGNGTVVNKGTITGAWDGTSTNGDGDGVDIDFIGTVKNWGTIKGISAHGVDSGGDPNGAEGIAMGGGLIENHLGALISGGKTGILVDDGSGGSAYGATTIVNDGTIEGLGGPAIVLVGDYADSVTNSGSIVGAGGVAIQMGGGNDLLILTPGASITGSVDGGTGVDTLRLSGTGAEDEVQGVFKPVLNFEQLDVSAGTWAMNDDATFTAGTTIGGSGRLNVNSVLTSNVVVNTGGTVGGKGTVSNLTVNAGGTIAPGENIGMLTVTGDLLQAADSTYAAEIAANGTGDRIVVGGTATVETGAVLKVTRAAGSYTPGTRYTLLTAADGVAGQYTLQQTVADGRELRLGRTGGTVFVDVARTAASLPGTAQTPNQRAVATSFGGFTVANAAYAALTLIPTDDATRAAFDALSGEIHASVRTSMTQDAMAVDNAVLARTYDIRDGGVSLWGQFLAGTGSDDGQGGAADADRNTIGGIGGIDVSFGNWLIGAAGGYTRDKTTVNDRLSAARIKSGHLVGYVAGEAGAFRLRGGVGYSWGTIDTARVIAFPGFADAAVTSYDGNTLHGFAQVGYAISETFEPFVGFSAYRVKTDPFAELGGLAGLHGVADRDTYASGQLGMRFDAPLGAAVHAQGSLAWQHGFSGVHSLAALSFNAGSTPFVVEGTALSKDAAALTLALVWDVNAAFQLSLAYDGLIGNSGDSHNGRATASFRF